MSLYVTLTAICSFKLMSTGLSDILLYFLSGSLKQSPDSILGSSFWSWRSSTKRFKRIELKGQPPKFSRTPSLISKISDLPVTNYSKFLNFEFEGKGLDLLIKPSLKKPLPSGFLCWAWQCLLSLAALNCSSWPHIWQYAIFFGMAFHPRYSLSILNFGSIITDPG